MAKPSSSAEDAVRRYLTWLKNPADLIDPDALARAQQKVERFTNGDPVQHLLAAAALERVKTVDEAPIRKAFVAALPAWAEEHGVSVEVLQSFGIPDDVLVDAKLLSRKRFEQRRAQTRRTRRAPLPSRAADGQPPEPEPEPVASNGHGTLDADEVAELVYGIPSRGTPFTVADLADQTGLTKDGARNKVNRAVAAGLLADIGVDDSDPTRRGKRPRLYERTS